ncbi:C2 domain-containing protein [Dirofilaria immitis]|nr:C2 domain-containing protein [Dirofilaria immitis]
MTERRGEIEQSSDDSDGATTTIQRDRVYPTNIKKILLTRKYHDTNVYNDIGVRVVGGKNFRMVNLQPSRSCSGMEWCTINRKTFEEVEQVIAASRGEIEVVVVSNPMSTTHVTSSDVGRNKDTKRQKTNENENRKMRIIDEPCNHSKKSEAPPVPAHRCVDGQTSLPSDSYSALKPTLDSKTVSLQPRNHAACMQQPDTLGYLNVALAYDRSTSKLMITVISAKSLPYRRYCNGIFHPNPFVKICLLPGRRVSSKRRTKFVPNTSEPVWDQTLEYIVPFHELYSHYLEFTVWDYDRLNDNNALGRLVISLSDPYVLDGTSRWYPLHPADNDLVMLGLPSPEFLTTTGTVNGCSVAHYNPTSLDISCPTI